MQIAARMLDFEKKCVAWCDRSACNIRPIVTTSRGAAQKQTGNKVTHAHPQEFYSQLPAHQLSSCSFLVIHLAHLTCKKGARLGTAVFWQ
jgi:hypothetical protein